MHGSEIAEYCGTSARSRLAWTGSVRRYGQQSLMIQSESVDVYLELADLGGEKVPPGTAQWKQLGLSAAHLFYAIRRTSPASAKIVLHRVNSRQSIRCASATSQYMEGCKAK